MDARIAILIATASLSINVFQSIKGRIAAKRVVALNTILDEVDRVAAAQIRESLKRKKLEAERRHSALREFFERAYANRPSPDSRPVFRSDGRGWWRFIGWRARLADADASASDLWRRAQESFPGVEQRPEGPLTVPAAAVRLIGSSGCCARLPDAPSGSRGISS